MSNLESDNTGGKVDPSTIKRTGTLSSSGLNTLLTAVPAARVYGYTEDVCAPLGVEYAPQDDFA